MPMPRCIIHCDVRRDLIPDWNPPYLVEERAESITKRGLEKIFFFMLFFLNRKIDNTEYERRRRITASSLSCLMHDTHDHPLMSDHECDVCWCGIWWTGRKHVWWCKSRLTRFLDENITTKNCFSSSIQDLFCFKSSLHRMRSWRSCQTGQPQKHSLAMCSFFSFTSSVPLPLTD